MNQTEDKIELKELADKFAIYGDQRKMQEQAALFSENGTVELYSGTVLTSTLQGRQEIEQTFTAYLDNFETAYHFNGQQTVSINQNTAVGIVYCTVTLIGLEKDPQIKTTIGMHYQDEYVKVDKQWRIDKREVYTDWQDKNPLL